MNVNCRMLAIGIASTLMLIASTAFAEPTYQQGVSAYKRGNYETALAAFRPLAAKGVPKAQAILGLMYSYGEGVSVDYSEAAKWYRKAAEQDYGVAQYNLGVLYAEGKGVPQDTEEAVRWLTRAANGGHFRARSMLKQLDPIAYSELPPAGEEAIAAPPDTTAPQTSAATTSGTGASAVPPPTVTTSSAAPKSVVMKSSSTPARAAPAPATPSKQPTTVATTAVTDSGHMNNHNNNNAKAVNSSATGDRIYRVQLGSSPSEDLIRRDWSTFQQRYPDLLADLDGRVERAEIGEENKVWYRLQVGTFASAANAKELCEQLQQRGLKSGCMPLRARR